MISVALHVMNGPHAGHRLWIRLEQVIHVGTTDRADVLIEPEPGGMPFDFTIGHSRAGCFVDCLNEQPSMLVNGQKVERARLKNDDILVVGGIEFRAIIE